MKYLAVKQVVMRRGYQRDYPSRAGTPALNASSPGRTVVHVTLHVTFVAGMMLSFVWLLNGCQAPSKHVTDIIHLSLSLTPPSPFYRRGTRGRVTVLPEGEADASSLLPSPHP